MANPYEIRIGSALREAWEIFLKGPEVFICISFASVLVSSSFAFLPVVGQLISLLVYAFGPAAIYLAADSGTGKEKISFESLKGLVPLAPQLLTLTVVKVIAIALGFCLLILPGFYLMVALVYAELFVLLSGKSFQDALKASWALVHGNLLGTFGLCAFLGVLALSGVLLVGIGILLTSPIALLTLYCVFRRISFRAP